MVVLLMRTERILSVCRKQFQRVALPYPFFNCFEGLTLT